MDRMKSEAERVLVSWSSKSDTGNKDGPVKVTHYVKHTNDWFVGVEVMLLLD